MLFAACSSSLEQMRLEGGLDGIPHYRFDNLSYLQLFNVRAYVTEFLELLSNCPNLTDLQLFHPKICEGGANDDYIFSLPNLRRLRIEIHPSVLAASLISKIPLSTSVATQIYAIMDDVPQEFLEAISQLPIMQATATVAISSKVIIAVTDVSGIRGPCSLMQALPMQQIRELWVYGPENHSRVDHCPTLLPFLVKLEVLVLCDTLQLDQVLDALAPPGNIKSRPVCPKLHTVRIIMTKNPWTAPSVFQRVAERQPQLQLSRFSCHWIPTYSDFFRTSYESEYGHLFPTTELDVKLLDHDGLARMKVPDACLADEDNNWPSMLRGPTHTLL
ncbi:uncharacterized protein LAESUDRAFT_712639 [Laetiporus sulphureus 93-53]|uniref:F-box domain-containing protein n=1 Tax=Laetiporus sulphureus 93-53 TaxID=1314785 RepID=A0A165FJX0_9APHY|nr:uncharacterized protein LAESUDRAFT_712639 [Laetiporus sulphureus 93-53]KZT09083.1 hypothetical protein LAESUDRAFT_712639 [Laetiporus sulphureus 93-53]